MTSQGTAYEYLEFTLEVGGASGAVYPPSRVALQPAGDIYFKIDNPDIISIMYIQ